MTSTIVVPLDGSPVAESALPFARELAARRGAPLTVASVVAVTAEFATWLNTGVEDSDRELGVWVENRKTYLESVIQRITDADVRAHVSVGRPTNMLLEFIQSLDDPIVVMASHGEVQPAEGTVGRRTLRLIPNLDAPIVVVKSQPQGQQTERPELTRVLVPLDGSEFAEQALQATLDILGEPHPSLHLVSILENDGSGTTAGGLVAEYFEAEREERTRLLKERAEELTQQGMTITWELREGMPASSIAAAADDSNASMIAMATHGRSGIMHALLGSVAEGVLHMTELPLLLIRPRGD